MNRKIRAALLQMLVGKNLKMNLKKAEAMISEAKKSGAELIILPECFNSPYGINFFSEYCENIPDGPSSEMLSNTAKQHAIYLVGGTIPEKCCNKIYNTCTTWNPEGKLILKYRKLHLYDVDIPGGLTFKESTFLSKGNELQTFVLNEVKIGVAICYDLRFEELAKLYRKQNCELLIYPGAFNMTTGPIHWELLQRSRALDNQIFVFGVSPARGKKGYIAWGHSQITNPWGKVIARAGYTEEIVYSDLNFKECDDIRQQIPIFSHRRLDIYDTIYRNLKSD